MRQFTRLSPLLIFGGGSLLLSACSSNELPLANEPDQPPNVLLISVDTLRADHLGLYGYERSVSPQIDALARESIVFEDAQATSSWTLPSLASLMTALYPASHRCVDTSTVLDSGFRTLAEELRDEGYYTGGIVTQAFASRRYGLDRGFAYFDDNLAELNRGRELFKKTSAELTQKAVRWFAARATEPRPRPWFLWIHYFDPHMAYVPHLGVSEEFGTETELDLYDGEIAWTDRHVGDVLDAMKQFGFDTNTIIVFTADHGEEFEDHGRLYHRNTLYREVLHVPLLIRIPGRTPERRAEVTSLVDVAPTVLNACFGSSSLEAQGADLTRSLAPEREAVYAELHRNDGILLFAEIGEQKSILEGVELEVFDRTKDPRELAPVEMEPERVKQKRNELQTRATELAKFAGHAKGSRPVTLSPEEREALKALGYTDGE